MRFNSTVFQDDYKTNLSQKFKDFITKHFYHQEDPLMKPFFHYSLHIKSHYTGQDFLRRKPKHTFNFKFTLLQRTIRFAEKEESEAGLKLLRALRIIKPVMKVDFRQFEVADPHFWETTFPSIFKAISRVKILFLLRLQNRSDEKYFRHFVRLRHLVYQLQGHSIGNRSHHIQSQNPLKYLKYCPKVRSLDVLDYSNEGRWTITPFQLKHSLMSLESLTFLTYQWDENQTNFPIKRFQNLTSIYLYFGGFESQKLMTQTMKDLSTLPKLQEIGLKIRANVDSAFITACKKVAQRRILKKLNFQIDREMSSNLRKSLEAFKDCQLQSFVLTAYFQKAQAIDFVSELIQSMSHLESLELRIHKIILFTKEDNIVEICQRISKLKALRSLKLNFYTLEKVSKSTPKILNFIPFLADIFTKPIKIERFSIECNQVDPSEAFQSIFPALVDSLTHLVISVGYFPYTQKTEKSILKLMQNLSNIQVLKITSLDFDGSNSKFLDSIVKTVDTFKYLRAFGIGVLKGSGSMQTLFQIVETILSKKGLREFSCVANDGIRNYLKEDPEIMNMKRIIEKNPYIAEIDFCDYSSDTSFLLKIFG